MLLFRMTWTIRRLRWQWPIVVVPSPPVLPKPRDVPKTDIGTDWSDDTMHQALIAGCVILVLMAAFCVVIAGLVFFMWYKLAVYYVLKALEPIVPCPYCKCHYSPYDDDTH
jgi:hypothetical protein